MKVRDRELAYAVLRIALGINLFMHGIARLGGNYPKFIAWTMELFANSPLPPWSVSLHAHAVPIVELGVGFLLTLGCLTRFAALAGSALMMTLIFGSALLQKWELVGLQMNYVLFYFLAIFLLEYNRYSLDEWIRAGLAAKDRKRIT